MTTNIINNAFLSSYTGPNKVSKNLIKGGNFTLNPWQRGVTFTGLAANAYSADTFLITGTNDAVVDVTQNADSPTATEASLLSNFCLQYAVTTADASIGAAQSATITTRIEGYDFTNIAQRQFTLSFWVKAVKTGIYCVSFVNSGGDRSYVAEYTINATATWEFKTVTATASPSAGTWNYTNGIGLNVNWTIAAGSNFQTTANAWNTGNFLCTSNQVNGLDSNTNTFKLALIQIEAGTRATPFEIQTEQEVLSACQRYYYKTFSQGVAPAQNIASVIGALIYRSTLAAINANGMYLTFPVTMAATPGTITTYNPNNTNANWRNTTAVADSGVATILSAGDRGCFVSNAQIVTDAAAAQMSIHVTANASL